MSKRGPTGIHDQLLRMATGATVEEVPLFKMFIEKMDNGEYPNLFALAAPNTLNFKSFTAAKAATFTCWKSSCLDHFDQASLEPIEDAERKSKPSGTQPGGDWHTSVEWYRSFEKDVDKLAKVTTEVAELGLAIAALQKGRKAPKASSCVDGDTNGGGGGSGGGHGSSGRGSGRGQTRKTSVKAMEPFEVTVKDLDAIWTLILILSDNVGLLSPSILMDEAFKSVLTTCAVTHLVPPLSRVDAFVSALACLRPPNVSESSGVGLPHELLSNLGPLMHALVNDLEQVAPPGPAPSPVAGEETVRSAAASAAGDDEEEDEPAAEKDDAYDEDSDELAELAMPAKTLTKLQVSFVDICFQQYQRQSLEHKGLILILSSLATSIGSYTSSLGWLVSELLEKCELASDPYDLGQLPKAPSKDARYHAARSAIDDLDPRLSELAGEVSMQTKHVVTARASLASSYQASKQELNVAMEALEKLLAEQHRVKTCLAHHREVVKRADERATAAAAAAAQAEAAASPGGSSFMGGSVSTARVLELDEPPFKRTKLSDDDSIDQFFNELKLKKRTPEMEEYIAFLEDQYEDIQALRLLLSTGGLEKGELLDQKGFKHAYRCKIAEALSKPIPRA